jgi:HlyD family secretion protein
MATADKSPIGRKSSATPGNDAVEFLPDADAIEMTPIHGGISYTLHLLALLLVTAFLWAQFSEVDQVVMARGRLVTPQPNIVLQPLDTAYIKSLEVRVGETVRRGQVLATFDPTFVAADLAQLQDRLASIDVQVRRLEAETQDREFITGKDANEKLQASLDEQRRANLRVKLKGLSEHVGRLRAAIDTNTRDIGVLDSRVKSLREIEDMNDSLSARQFQSRRSLLESREKRLEVERELVNARSRSAELKRELAAAESERASFARDWRQKALEELITVRREKDALTEQIVKARMRSARTTLVAPVDGVIQEIAKRSPGSIVRETEALLTLVPLNVPLEAEIQIESSDIGFVRVGEPARIKVDAYPFQKHGVLKGRLGKLGQDTQARDATGALPPSLVYIGRVELGDTKLHNLGREMTLLPGMTLTAEIVVGTRTVMSYLLYPIRATIDEAAREP